ncbi:MAG TPA: fumarylacetoacetate hydrolase family protein [Anaerolineales bacterium]|nr:fumarylacetoacetate hydrolase family protein [Anaerolineales bacterium]HMV96903.1 fumarylacetoacetate hydrolase family protein [Anaerolineales bacterium]HMX21308.1 fumarylacetoacetate hydrolase family protein [Anaerolineales bacterium]HMX76349.1 fumarylacetoacetate hydrolase family protein [Anaerolineales bacterium]HMZ45078.1 fumarylacetoacetate hydrolase family protein [Anaerolineales bacterium]
MKIVRYQTNGEAVKYGWMLDDKVGEIQGDIFGEYRRREAKIPVGELKLAAPCVPSKILCVGRNYVEHAKELGNEVPKVPLIFLKPPSSIISNGEHIVLPPQSSQVEHEAELVVVIGKRGRNITIENAKEYVFGYTIGNDITARDLQKTDGQWTRAKGFDTFCSFGPWIDTEFDASDAVVTCRVNGQMRQMASTRDMVFNINTLIAFISSVMTLEAGDIIFTGTPSGVGELKNGDMVDVEIEGLGKLSNPVKS